MAVPFEWQIVAALQPKPEELAFDLDRVLASVTSLRARIPEDAFTAPILGTERGGSGVVIGEDGLVVTIGYLITEAETVWLVGEDTAAAPAHVVGYDQATGFGLVQALKPLGLPAIELGDSASLREGDAVVVAGHGGRRHALAARVVAKREFAGYWEYVLDEGIFTAPPHPDWGGTALIGGDGKLRGIGSLLVQQAVGGEPPIEGNMIVPIDLLKPILDDLVRFGRTRNPPRPWLGMYTMEAEDTLVVTGLARRGPAQQAGVQVGDVVVGVGGEPVSGLAALFRRIWAVGGVGVEVPLTVVREGQTLSIRVESANRADYLKSPRLH